MLDSRAAEKDLKRLFKLPFAPKDPQEARDGFAEFLRIARRDCTSLNHLKAVVDSMMDTEKAFPAPAALVESCRVTPDPGRTMAPLGCEHCKGSGWYSYSRTVSPAGVAPYEADFAEFCSCERGEWMCAAEANRKEEAQSQRRSKGMDL